MRALHKRVSWPPDFKLCQGLILRYIQFYHGMVSLKPLTHEINVVK
ncbi:hypothetical protein AtNW77_Chr1g0022121 [Arabidopsis thaliana]